MKLKTFRAPTMADALTAVKKDLGRSAVILHTRSYKSGGFFGFRRKPVVEIIASDEPAPRRPQPRPPQPRSPEPRPLQGRPPHARSLQGSPDWTRDRPEAPPAERAARAARSPLPSERPTPAGPVPFGTIPAALAAYARTAAPQLPVVVTASPDLSPMTLPVRKRRERAFAPEALPGTADLPEAPAAREVALLTLDAPSVSPIPAALEHELAAIKRMVGQVLRQSGPTFGTIGAGRPGAGGGMAGEGGTGGGGTGGGSGTMPEPLFNQYLRLLEGQVERELADRIAGAVRDELSPAELTDEDTVRRTMLRHLAALLPVAETVPTPAGDRAHARRRRGPLVIALVGPTGVGKTTTVAKLAAAYKLRHGLKVGIVTSDTYRIAAVDQIRTYANIIAVPLRVVLSPAEMAAAVAGLDDCDVVLIDTAGRSQHDAERLDELRAFVAAAAPDETHLVLSSAASESVLLKTAERFAGLKPNRVLFTKLDEAVHFGVLVNVATRVGATLSYVTTGQEVPDHIEPGRPDRLARLILDGELTR